MPLKKNMPFSFIATLVLLGGLIWLLLSLFLSIWRYGVMRKKSGNALPAGLSAELAEEFGPVVTGRRLKYVRWFFALLVLTSLGFHAYWGLFSTGPLGNNLVYEGLKDRRDQRNRREVESTLRGWIFDRNHDVNKTLAKYRYLNGRVIRDYPLGVAASHLIGYGTFVRGDILLERAVVSQPVEKEKKKWWEELLGMDESQLRPPVGKDMVLTIDYDLQKAAYEQLNGRRGAVVMLNPQTGEVYAMASSPSFDPAYADLNEKWEELQKDTLGKPLLNRVLNEYYLPGSTFKTLTASAAVESRLDTKTYFCRAEGWTPPGSSRPIRDDEGESHGNIDLFSAYTYSCNQYFAQLGVDLDRQRMGEAATRFGMVDFANPTESIGAGYIYDFWNTSNRVLSSVFAPLKSTFASGRSVTKYDLGLESIGQGYVQLTPFEMALVAAAVGNKQGMVMRPMLELGKNPESLSQAMSPQGAARMRSMMASVVQRGTAAGALAFLRGRISAGGKTGTAQRQTISIDPKTNKPIILKDSKGREFFKREIRIDSWFIGIAPVDNPTIAFAVIVEGGGYGAKTSAPIAGNLLLKAQSLKLLN